MVQIHPEPTPATVRYLYGNCSSCAYPGCDEPLYKELPERADRVRNSTVAHIHARRQNGPRWKGGMTADENRDQSNLLVLCLMHSNVIDQFPNDYPAETLRDWKQQAELQTAAGVALTDAELNELMQLWMQQDISLTAETIILGGSLGGGGGAIGFGAIGGDGGDVSIFPEIKKQIRSRGAAKEPSVGRGTSEGFDGQPGGPSALLDGDKVVLAAGGGGGGFVGSGVRSTTDQLGVSALMLTNSSDVRDQLCFVLGGAWGRFTVGELPANVGFTALVVIEAGGVPEGEYSLHVALVRPDGSDVARASFPVSVLEAGAVLRIVRVVTLFGTLDEVGLHHVVASSETAELSSVAIAIFCADDTQPRSSTVDDS